GQDRPVRNRPELGANPRGSRHHQRGIPAGLARRGDQRDLGVPGRCRRRATLPSGSYWPDGATPDRAARRGGCRHRLDQRLDPWLHTRKLGVFDMNVTLTRDLSLAQTKAATLIEALPWLARFHGTTV